MQTIISMANGNSLDEKLKGKLDARMKKFEEELKKNVSKKPLKNKKEEPLREEKVDAKKEEENNEVDESGLKESVMSGGPQMNASGDWKTGGLEFENRTQETNNLESSITDVPVAKEEPKKTEELYHDAKMGNLYDESGNKRSDSARRRDVEEAIPVVDIRTTTGNMMRGFGRPGMVSPPADMPLQERQPGDFYDIRNVNETSNSAPWEVDESRSKMPWESDDNRLKKYK